jgi:hypothetical protein
LDTLGKEKTTIDAANKYEWGNKNDEECGFIRVSISLYLWFHIRRIDDPVEACNTLEKVFGKHNEIQAH